ncbi:Ig-like domain-containing protein [Candidatus Entotheonella palauensis]|uniref:Ig-like domain-containing protein n=1 Tax=Candidatus Entotheonella palauensis TaxID=93172 RepID=UPI000B7D5EC6|nr:Ig-like domain-containing protein [Candidatus Entotheonella palauensis]
MSEAIFNARPLTTAYIGNVSFDEAFGTALVKSDLIFSAVEDLQGRLWAGTLGGGVRRVEAIAGTWQDTLHLTRAKVARVDTVRGRRVMTSSQGLSSNIIFALTVGPDGSIWAATDQGADRIRESDGRISITSFSAVDGLRGPVRDVAVDAQGTAWLATDHGLFRITSQASRVTGLILASGGHAIVNADVDVFSKIGITLRDTPFRAVTDAAGRFQLPRLPAGTYVLRITGRDAAGGSIVTVFREITISETDQELSPSVVTSIAPGVTFDPGIGGFLTFPNAPGSALDISPQSAVLPLGAAQEIALTQLPLSHLPFPLPAHQTAVAAANLKPSGAVFDPPVALTLANQGGLETGAFADLLYFDETDLTYKWAGYGQISADGATITTIRGGLSHFSTFVFVSPSTINNSPPIASDDAYRVQEDTHLIVTAANGVLINDIDADGDRLTSQLLREPTHGVLDMPFVELARMGHSLTFPIRIFTALIRLLTKRRTA